MKARKLGLLIASTVVMSSVASMQLAAKDLHDSSTLSKPAATEANQAKEDAKPLETAEKAKPRPHMDLAFCIDTTGSMQGEIDMVKAKVKDLVSKLASGKPAPIVRVGLVAFRDRQDEYVTKVYPFTDDIDKFVKDISELKAQGGGDGPEAVNQALHSSITDLKWDESNKTAKLLFLIGDAEPKRYPNDYKWEDESKKAIAAGIQINTLGCHGLDNYGEEGVKVFEGIAKLADGKFERLSYRQVVSDGAGGEKTFVTSGGASFEVSSAARSEWKKGATELAKEGKAKTVVSASPAMMYSAPGAAGSKSMLMGRMSPRASMRGASMASMDAAYSGGGGGAAGMAVDRKDSNLDSLMYDAALKRASDKLKVDYGK